MVNRQAYNANSGSLLDWIKQHSYMIFVALILIVGDWAVFDFRLSDIETHIKEVEVKSESNKAKIQALELQYARDLTEIKTILLRVDASVSDLIRQQSDREREITEFYRKYGGVLDNLIKEN